MQKCVLDRSRSQLVALDRHDFPVPDLPGLKHGFHLVPVLREDDPHLKPDNPENELEPADLHIRPADHIAESLQVLH